MGRKLHQAARDLVVVDSTKLMQVKQGGFEVPRAHQIHAPFR